VKRLPRLEHGPDGGGRTFGYLASFAGMLTLLVEKYGKQGNFNQPPTAWRRNRTNYAAIFHDITTGSNLSPVPRVDGCVGGLVGL